MVYLGIFSKYYLPIWMKKKLLFSSKQVNIDILNYYMSNYLNLEEKEVKRTSFLISINFPLERTSL